MAAVVVAAHHMRAGEGQVLDAADQVITTDFGQENAASIHVPDSARKKVERSPLLSVQRRMLSNMKNRASGARLHASNLADRLLFESSLVRGVFRLVNQALVFSLMLIALSLAGDPSAKRGIYNNLKDTFDFDGLRDMRSRAAFMEALPAISQSSKSYFLLSSQYFETGQAGNVQLLGGLKSFSSPMLLGGIDVTIQAPQISFTVWVKATPQYMGGYLLRKRLVPAGDGSDLSCWGWYFGKEGPELHYGVHDVFPTELSQINAEARQVEVKLDAPHPFQPDTYALMTLIVSETHVYFYNNKEAIGSSPLKRPVTDCNNNFEGVLIGGAGLEMGQLRFYPRALQATDIEEIYQFGAPLSDMSTGSEPTQASEDGLSSATRSLQGSIAEAHDTIRGRQYELELAQVAQAVMDQNVMEYSVPIMAGGDTPCESWDATAGAQVTTADASGRDFHQLLTGPYRLAETPADNMRYLTNVPSFEGTGMTLTFWYRHTVCTVATCGVYLFHVGDFSGLEGVNSWCWTFWVENNGIWMDSPGPGYVYFKDMPGLTNNLQPSGDKTWRHMALQFDEVDNNIRFYIDGTLASTFQAIKPLQDVESLNCRGTQTSVDPTAKKISLGHKHPGKTYWRDVSLADLRMYVHGTQGRLTDTQVMNIAMVTPMSTGPTPTALIDSKYQCLPLTSSQMSDKTWLDAQGHDCLWFYKAKNDKPDVCNLKAAQDNCAISCKSKQECFVKKAPYPTYFTWDRARLIRPKHANGSMCLGNDLKKEDVVKSCEAAYSKPNTLNRYAEVWDENDGDKMGAFLTQHNLQGDRNYLDLGPWYENTALSGPQPRGGQRLNMTNCSALAEAIDDFCEFDMEPVKNFTRDLKALGGDYTIAFWVKPIGPESQLTHNVDGATGRFFPHIKFMNQITPPTHLLSLGYQVNPNGEFRMNSKCAPPTVQDGGTAPYGYWNIEVNKASNSDWTFFAVTVRNISQNDDHVTLDGSTFTNTGINSESTASYFQCLWDESSFFQAIEVNYPMLITPIMMIPKYLPIATVQQEYLTKARSMSIRTGPLVTNSERTATRVQVEKGDFTPRSTLMAAPIIFQTRADRTANCSFKYGTEFIARQHEKALNSKCAAPFSCDGSILQAPEAVISCLKEPEENSENWSEYFGLSPIAFMGKMGYADFLYAITDNDFVFRNELLDTSTFVDSASQAVQVVFVFFTPAKGIVTLLNIVADLSGTENIDVSVDVAHYSILEGNQLIMYMAVQSIVLVNLAVMFFDVFSAVAKHISDVKQGRSPKFAGLVEPLVDMASASLVLVYIILRFPGKMKSADETARILGNLDQIPWASPKVALNQKKTDFFKNVADLTALIDNESFMNVLCNIILLVNLLRVIQCTSVHPRLALLTGTVANAADDLWHTALLTCMLMLCFAGIGTWRFGNTMEEFGSLEDTLQTEFQMLFGDFPYDWANDPALPRELQAFTVLYFIVLFLLVLNFLLAIIVEAYMQLRNAMKSKETEQAIFTDCAHTMSSVFWGGVYGWPSTRYLGADVSAWTARNSVGYRDLLDTGLFRNDRSVIKFLEFYSKYHFLKPAMVGKYGKAPSQTSEWTSRGAYENADSAHLAFVLDRKMKLASDQPPLSLRQEVRGAIENVMQRRETQGRLASAQTLRALLATSEPEKGHHEDIKQVPSEENGPPLLKSGTLPSHFKNHGVNGNDEGVAQKMMALEAKITAQDAKMVKALKDQQTLLQKEFKKAHLETMSMLRSLGAIATTQTGDGASDAHKPNGSRVSADLGHPEIEMKSTPWDVNMPKFW